MAMEWTEETITRLRELWQQGLSTAEIGRQLEVTKNAVVGKAHRLGLQARPSPIRRPAASARPTVKAPATPAASVPTPAQEVTAASVSTPVAPVAATDVPSVPSVATQPPQPVAEVRPVAAAPVPPAPPVVAPPVAAPRAEAPAASAADKEAVPAARAEVRVPLRAVAPPAPRRSGLTCCWPLGDPGTPGFHFCGATPVPGKPYCVEHAQLAYVKLRDRRDNVA
ncbi:GcrA cell cycle regulator [Gluconacetobacter azotocaptans]|uniref:GcrA cell cycle regulator n=3 Tax=Gluconacetobacter azotocaptans TaxID=142834 RepID=A0A7W4JT17_9PROT|nr:GcrA cell cycle regulator [Gluconacetobacter azotocaptans]